MFSNQLRRAGLLAGGSALALAAGLLTGGPAAARPAAPAAPAGLVAPAAPEGAAHLSGPARAGSGAPAGQDARRTPPSRVTARIARPAKSGAASASAARAKPRLDLDYDGYSEVLEQGYRHDHIVYLTSTGQSGDWYAFDQADPEEVFVDVVPTGDLGSEPLTDIATVSADGRLSVYTALTDRTTKPRWTGRGWQVYNRVLGAGDLTRDGRPDLLARTHSGDLYLYKGTGKIEGGPFAARVKVGSGWGIYDQLVAANDVDGDTVGDVVARTVDGNLWFYKGTGSATTPFKPRVKIGGGWNAYNQIIGADDMNDDGRSDLLARKWSGEIVYYLATGGGKFSAATHWGSGWYYSQFLAGAGTTHVYGRAQTVGVTADQHWYKWLNVYNSTFEEEDLGVKDPLPAGTRASYAAGLHNRDHASVMEMLGKILYLNGPLASTTWDYTASLGVGDLTGDGKGDVLARDRAGALWLFPGNGAYETKLGARVKIGTGWNAYNALVGAGDYSGDGRADLVARDTAGKVWLLRGTGSAAAPFAARVQVASGWGGYNLLLAPGDVDGDGKGDLLARDAAGTLLRICSTGRTGTATFKAPVKMYTGWSKYKMVF